MVVLVAQSQSIRAFDFLGESQMEDLIFRQPEEYRWRCYQKRWAVVGFDRERGEQIVNSIAGRRRESVAGRISTGVEFAIVFEDGVVINWISKAAAAFLGYKFGRLWCSQALIYDQSFYLQNVILPMYMGRYRDIVFM